MNQKENSYLFPEEDAYMEWIERQVLSVWMDENLGKDVSKSPEGRKFIGSDRFEKLKKELFEKNNRNEWKRKNKSYK